MDPAVTVVVPSYRGACRLGELVRRLMPLLDRLDGEAVLVDDASDDETWATMESLALEHPRLRCARLGRHSGQQVATLAGCALARGRWVATLDDDLEHRPEDLPLLLERARRGYDLVYAVPRRRSPRPLRLVGSRVFDLATRLLIGKPRRVRLTSFRVMRRELVERMLGERVRSIYVSALALRLRPRISTLSVEPGPAVASRTRVGRLLGTFGRTLLSYGPVGRRVGGREARLHLPVAEVRGFPP